MRLTMAQALLRFLSVQRVQRDGVEGRFFAGCFGIFGHGNVAGIGQALYESPDLLTYHQARNEQSMVHAAVAFARVSNRMTAMACTSSIGPGATNMVTGAAVATINHLPVLLLPGDVFASHRPDPVLQQLETPWDMGLSVNDCFRPVSRFFARIHRPEALIPAAVQAMRVLTSQADTGAVTLALPQDVQAEAWDYPAEFLVPRTWFVARPQPDPEFLERAARQLSLARRPLIVAGGGAVYSAATGAIDKFITATGIPVAVTQAGKGALPYDHPLNLGAIGATGTAAANRMAREADVVIGIGTRWTDFTTASKTLFEDPELTFININAAEFDAAKLSGLMLVGDARATVDALAERLRDHRVDPAWRGQAEGLAGDWDREVDRLYHLSHGPLPAQSEVIGAVNDAAVGRDVVVCAAGSMPGDLHKLWRTRDPQGYHVEYGFSCMGYEIAAGVGIKLASPDREVFVLVGDGSYLMLSQEIVTAVQERLRVIVVLVDNSGYGSIGSLSRSLGSEGFGTLYRYRDGGSLGLDREGLEGRPLPVDLAANAESLGARVYRTQSIEELRKALVYARNERGPVVIHIMVDRYESVPSYESWWDVPVAEVSESEAIRAARVAYEADRARARQL